MTILKQDESEYGDTTTDGAEDMFACTGVSLVSHSFHNLSPEENLQEPTSETTSGGQSHFSLALGVVGNADL